jgi:hypothetical protein
MSGAGPWGAGQNFSVVLAAIPGTVILGAPSGAIGNTPLPTYSWTALSGATSYNFYLKNSSNTVLLNVTSVTAICAAGICSYTPSTALTTDSYTWYVQAVNASGTGPWGTGQNFSVAMPVILGTPVGAIGNTPLPTYSWTELSGATSYNFYLKNSGNAALLNVTSVPATCTAGTCSYTPATALTTDSYTWYVQAVTATGTGSWGTGQNFSVALSPVPGAVTLVTPAGAIGNTPLPTYSWTELSGATSYNFYLVNSGNAALLNVPSVPATCAAGTCSYTPATALTTDSYTWYVQAVNATGSGTWGTGQNFSVSLLTPPGAVSLLSPSGPGAPSLPTYSWTELGGATSYNFYLVNSGNAALLNVPSVPATCTAGTCSYTPATALTTDSYTWYVQAVNSAGTGSWGTGMSFSSP